MVGSWPRKRYITLSWERLGEKGGRVKERGMEREHFSRFLGSFPDSHFRGTNIFLVTWTTKTFGLAEIFLRTEFSSFLHPSLSLSVLSLSLSSLLAFSLFSHFQRKCERIFLQENRSVHFKCSPLSVHASHFCLLLSSLLWNKSFCSLSFFLSSLFSFLHFLFFFPLTSYLMFFWPLFQWIFSPIPWQLVTPTKTDREKKQKVEREEERGEEGAKSNREESGWLLNGFFRRQAKKICWFAKQQSSGWREEERERGRRKRKREERGREIEDAIKATGFTLTSFFYFLFLVLTF